MMEGPLPGFVHIVDDDPSFRTAIERRLKRTGYEVATYVSAQHLRAAFSWTCKYPDWTVWHYSPD
jgi:FixJ family two-component response regulator